MSVKSSPVSQPAAQPRPRTKPAEVRLEELMTAAESLFLSQGVEATTISEIVQRADVAKGTFYHYFPSKNELLVALGQRYTQNYLQRLETAVAACPEDDWVAKVSCWIGTSVQAYLDTYRLHDIVYPNHHHHDRGNPEKSAILTQLLGILDGGQRAGCWSLAQPGVMASLIYAGVHGATDDVIAAGEEDGRALAEAIVQACLRLLGLPLA
ncbi:TetR/AcrR family transcriptional regulator [Pseudomonas sp. Au-Pse12]|uniref:TetR/AcrR family transcriptional regulator n=1 Tax=Pseudomonas sp. Au-Pse12 TaxID=2906459 RepID=UPI001E512A2D|nr:TetR/AcrR family transcriptional regulator [Pseudomonas sp. Au-Pse12]MCE4056885.1 TetR/AcrR family transcriptional regulator [Pseudomonas sp. Au-Pse12]